MNARDSLAALLREIQARGDPWPAPVEWEERLASTNDRLKEKARGGAPELSAVLADEQTGGRGRQGTRWVSPRGNLFLSVLLRPPADVALGVLPLVAGVAVRDALAAFGVAGGLKWPNDLVVEGRKVGGILTEASWSEGALDSVVVGIGVNVGLRRHDLPAPLADLTTSVSLETGRSPLVSSVGAEVLQSLRLWYHALTREGVDALVAAWRSRSVPWWGRVVEVQVGEEVVRGVAVDVDRAGALTLERSDGTRMSLLAGNARELRVQ